MAWYLNRALTNFRSAVNAAYPDRDKASDGTIGDEAHQNTSSDHNPDPDGSVDAWDMDVEVNGKGKPYAADVAALKKVFEAHESSHYWIHNDQISFRSEGWNPRSYAYAGAKRNRHTQHVHWNSRESHETSNKPWVIPGSEVNVMFCKRGDKGTDAVETLQRMLADMGYYKGAIDQDYGPATSAALLACRLAMGSVVTSGDVYSPAAYTQVHRAYARWAAGAGKEGPRGPQGIQGVKGDKGDPGEYTPAEVVRLIAEHLSKAA